MKIVGVGFDPPEKTAAWVAREGYRYEIWTDDERTLATRYGAVGLGGLMPSRVTKVLDAEGVLVLEYLDVNAGAHPAEVLGDVKQVFGR